MARISNIIMSIFKEDQCDRRKFKSGFLDSKSLQLNDKRRRHKLYGIIKNKRKEMSSANYFYAAIPFHHSHNVAHLKIALKLAKESVIRGYKRGKKLMMEIEDRLCLVEGVPQKHGTQFLIRNGKLVKYKKG